MKNHPAPWKWECTACDDPHGFEVECDDFEEGCVRLVDANGEEILQEWAIHAESSGIESDPDVMKAIESLPAFMSILKRALGCLKPADLVALSEKYGPKKIEWYKDAQKELHRATGKYYPPQ